MSIRNGLLALLSQEPMGVYQLRKEFEARTGRTWPLNIGQVYSTMQRLERDGLVFAAGAVDQEVERFELTVAGAASASSWWTDPVLRGAPERDELVIKLALAVTVPGVDVRAVLQTQRRETMRALRDYTRLKTDDDATRPGGDLAWSLVLEHHIFAAEAEIRWLDHIEASVHRVRQADPAEEPAAGVRGAGATAALAPDSVPAPQAAPAVDTAPAPQAASAGDAASTGSGRRGRR